jgi:hypothetical protein
VFLDLQGQLGDGAEAQQVRRMAATGLEVPGVVVLLAMRPEWTAPWNRLAQGIMRGPGHLPPWQRELIAALTSRHNHCLF